MKKKILLVFSMVNNREKCCIINKNKLNLKEKDNDNKSTADL